MRRGYIEKPREKEREREREKPDFQCVFFFFNINLFEEEYNGGGVMKMPSRQQMDRAESLQIILYI